VCVKYLIKPERSIFLGYYLKKRMPLFEAIVKVSEGINPL
jgi:hypothetical protein